GFSQVKIDATKVQTNQTGEWKKLADVNAAAKVYLAKIENKEFVPVTDGVAALGETVKTKNGKYDKIASLMDYLLVYENNGAPVKNFDLKVPVTLSYYWGELTTDVVIPVRETYKETETPAE
ncbi:MAG: hypothetical protein Q4G10_09295, partial [Bacteroidia bacterium]|nr:hypothetical protein [Bacteroidia bacterium]